MKRSMCCCACDFCMLSSAITLTRCYCKTNAMCSLEENDKIKSDINPRKINEPKTPYHGPMEEEPGCGMPGNSCTSLTEP